MLQYTQGSLCWKTMDDSAYIEDVRRVVQGTASGDGCLGITVPVLLKRSGF